MNLAGLVSKVLIYAGQVFKSAFHAFAFAGREVSRVSP